MSVPQRHQLPAAPKQIELGTRDLTTHVSSCQERRMPPRRRPWFPFTATEVQIVLGSFAFLFTCLGLIGVERRALAWSTLGYVLLVYLAGLLVHARRIPFAFMRDGALQGLGYVPYLRRAKRSLLLLHTDDDPPGEELLGLYRAL